ncbi:MAG: hypothetical protein LBE20_07335 [Deltaproteobacteria bacterium]|jgi:hypothetical protein|nr:hypothetical protein [Deltaproteobacteria bacterium]
MNNNKGNSILEMILFLPLAFLFGILALDAVFAMTDKSAITDAIRSGLGDYKTSPVPIFQSNGNDEINQDFLNWTVQKILKNLGNTTNESEQDILDAAQVKVSAVRIKINNQTGQQIAIEITREASQGNLPTTLNNSSLISTTLANYNLNQISPFAIKQRGVINSSKIYKDFAILIFASASVRTRSINSTLRNIFFANYDVQAYQHFIAI